MRTGNIIVLIQTLYLAIAMSGTLAAQIAVPVTGNPQVGLLRQGEFLSPADLPPQLAALHEGLGSRLATAEKAQLTVSGTLTDAEGARSAQLTIQSPGFLSFRDDRGRALLFNETGFQGVTGSSASEDAIIESLLAHFPDTFLLQAAGGGSFRRIGSHFRGNAQDNGPIPLWTVLAYSPGTRSGLTRGKALQQELFIAIDERTGLPADIRVLAQTGATKHVTQTQISGWTLQSGQWFPGRIIRLEDGQQKLRFDVVSASTGPALPLAAFRP